MIHDWAWRHNYDTQIEFSVSGSKSLIFCKNIENYVLNKISKICKMKFNFRHEISILVFWADDSSRSESFSFSSIPWETSLNLTQRWAISERRLKSQ